MVIKGQEELCDVEYHSASIKVLDPTWLNEMS